MYRPRPEVHGRQELLRGSGALYQYPGLQGRLRCRHKAGNLNSVIEYTFDYNMKPAKVEGNMKKALVGDS
jgi:hypothetical protein